MALRRHTQLNPELENLRLQALNSVQTSYSNEELQEVIRATRRLHAAFLFHSPKALQPLLMAIGETNIEAVGSGWQSFADKLGLDVSTIKIIKNNEFSHEDPVYNTLLRYVQYPEATIGKIVQALLEMGRLDVIMRTKDVLLQLSELILNREQELIRSSWSSSDYGSLASNENTTAEIAESNGILRPVLIPDAPFILKNVQSAPLISDLLLPRLENTVVPAICSSNLPQLPQILAPECLQQATPVNNVPTAVSPSVNDSPKQVYTRKVMLTFAADGAGVAAEVAQVMRRQRGMGRIGVLVLGEQTRHLQADPNLFICSSYQLVDYVVPILTEGYLRTVLRRLKNDTYTNECVDANYVPFIYQTMVQDYIRRGCLNDKVRCLIPDDQLIKVKNHLMAASPLFTAWESASRADVLAERILAAEA